MGSSSSKALLCALGPCTLELQNISSRNTAIFVPVLIHPVCGYQSIDDACRIFRMPRETVDSLLADLYTHLSMWWAKRTERRLAMRRYRLELRAARRLQ